MGLLGLEKRHLERNLIKAFGTNKITEKIEPCLLLKCRVGGLDTAVINYTGKILATYKEKNPHGNSEEQEQVARKVVKFASLKVFKTQLHRLKQEVGPEASQAPFKPE